MVTVHFADLLLWVYVELFGAKPQGNTFTAVQPGSLQLFAFHTWLDGQDESQQIHRRSSEDHCLSFLLAQFTEIMCEMGQLHVSLMSLRPTAAH